MLGYLVFQTAGQGIVDFLQDLVETFIKNRKNKKISSLPLSMPTTAVFKENITQLPTVESPLKPEDGEKSMEEQQAVHMSGHKRLSSAMTVIEQVQSKQEVA